MVHLSTLPFIIGTGSFSFDGDPGTGSFALDSLANYTFNFLFNGGNAYENHDIVTPHQRSPGSYFKSRKFIKTKL